MNTRQLRRLYEETLLDDVIPWWERHGIDPNGGINSCIQDDGTLINRDRWNWSQWRAVWVFSALYNKIEQRERWLEIAEGIYDFVSAHGPLESGHWPLLLSGEGEVQKGYESIYVDGFALYGLAELYRATGDPAVRKQGRRTLRALHEALDSPEPPPAYPYPIPKGLRPHGISMLTSLSAYEFGAAADDRDAAGLSVTHHRLVMERYWREDRQVLLEWLAEDGREVPPPKGTAVVPGHAIESMWFQIHIALARGDRNTVEQALRIMRRHLELGWDDQEGGLFLAVDAEGREEVAWEHAEKKLWWPHTEALYGTLLAQELGVGSGVGDMPWAMEWHEKVREWSYDHFPVSEHGEWTQKLDRQGKPLTETLVLPVKDPFHLPRALIYLVRLLREGANAVV
ncbi:MAG: AGE family epimerase/isomerase [Alkalispirochaetaceae bacterium]